MPMVTTCNAKWFSRVNYSLLFYSIEHHNQKQLFVANDYGIASYKYSYNLQLHLHLIML